MSPALGQKAWTYNVVPVAKPRMTQRDKWKNRPSVAKYWAYRDEIRAAGFIPPDTFKITFYMPMPKSWSRKKKDYMMAQPHQQRPDRDNLEKAFEDCFGEDSRFWSVWATKLWSLEGWIEVEELPSQN